VLLAIERAVATIRSSDPGEMPCHSAASPHTKRFSNHCDVCPLLPHCVVSRSGSSDRKFISGVWDRRPPCERLWPWILSGRAANCPRLCFYSDPVGTFCGTGSECWPRPKL